MSRFHGPRSIQWPGRGCAAGVWPSRPGRASSVVPVSTLVIDPSFFRRLPRREPRKRPGRDIFRYHRTRRKPHIVADLHRSIERIVDTGPDVAPDARHRLRLARLVLEVRRDVAVADVGEVRDLRARADDGLLHLDEGADLRLARDGRARTDEGERPDLDSGRDRDRAADDGERMDGHVVLDLDVVVDPRRL